eukprot:15341073-Ditylum_brightwellii.AAC.1
MANIKSDADEKSATRKDQGSKGRHSSKHGNYKQGKATASAVYKNMRFLSKKEGGGAEGDSFKAHIMSLFKDKDAKKDIRASVLSADAIEI